MTQVESDHAGMTFRKDKDKAELELSLSKDVICDKMFHNYINNKRKRSEYENPLLNWTE